MTAASEALAWRVKSRLLPLSHLESALEWLVEQLPRQHLRVELKPMADVLVLNEGEGEFKAIGSAPEFEITCLPDLPGGGWYYLEAALVRNNGSREANIRAIVGAQCKEAITIPIPTNLRGTVREVFFLPQNVSVLRWSPTAAPGFFSQSPLLLHKISSLESVLRRMWRVMFDLWRFRRSTIASRAGLTWWGAVRSLQDAYQRGVTLRAQRLLGNDYSAFIAREDSTGREEIRTLAQLLGDLRVCPLVSLIMPVSRPLVGYFREALDSVVSQPYPHWELLLVGDFSACSQGRAIATIAEEYRGNGTRLRIVSVETGIDLARTLNSAIDLAHGEFVVRINQHDRLAQPALLCLALEVNKNPDLELIYTDDDNIDSSGKRCEPRFKPDWNPDLLTSHHYLSNLVAYRLPRLRQLLGYRMGFEGAEDYELALRYTNDLQPEYIRHIPQVLYHQRRTSGPKIRSDIPRNQHRVSSLSEEHIGVAPQRGEMIKPGAPETSWEDAIGVEEEQLVHDAGKHALEARFRETGVVVEDGLRPSLYRIRHPLPVSPPLVSIIIPTRDRVEILRTCIESIQLKTDYTNWEMLVVDNGSTDSATLNYLSELEGQPRIRVLRYDQPFNFSAINNYAAMHAKGEILALLNNDVEVITADWLTEMVSHAIRPGVGAVGAKLLYSNGTVQHAGVIIGLGGVAGHGHKYIADDVPGYCYRAAVTQNLSAVTAACLVVQKVIYQEVGGMNAVDLVVALNDIDFCLKLREAGYRNVYTPYAKLFHHESISRGHDDTPEKRAIFLRECRYMQKTWGDRLKSDPAYNPNLSLEFEDFSLSRGLLPN